jgi:hypothetical protein
MGSSEEDSNCESGAGRSSERAKLAFQQVADCYREGAVNARIQALVSDSIMIRINEKDGNHENLAPQKR